MKKFKLRKLVLFFLPLAVLACSCGSAPASGNTVAGTETEKMLTEPETTSVADVTTQSETETTADKTEVTTESVAATTVITQSETEITQAESETETENETEAPETQAPKTMVTLSPPIADNGIPAENIAGVYVSHHSFMFTESEHKIDLENGRYWAWIIDWDDLDDSEWPMPKKRDENAENAGFDLISDLSADKIAAFCAEADNRGFTSWDDEYIDPLLMDGHQWYVEITYLDGSVKKILGSNDYPDTWGEMGEAFMNLTGFGGILD